MKCLLENHDKPSFLKELLFFLLAETVLSLLPALFKTQKSKLLCLDFCWVKHWH